MNYNLEHPRNYPKSYNGKESFIPDLCSLSREITIQPYLLSMSPIRLSKNLSRPRTDEWKNRGDPQSADDKTRHLRAVYFSFGTNGGASRQRFTSCAKSIDQFGRLFANEIKTDGLFVPVIANGHLSLLDYLCAQICDIYLFTAVGSALIMNGYLSNSSEEIGHLFSSVLDWITCLEILVENIVLNLCGYLQRRLILKCVVC